MKTGHLLAISAVALFTATIFWSSQQQVQHQLYKPGQQTKPTRVDANSFFFQTESIQSVSISAPVEVELDAGFSGLELQGDTSVLKHLWVNRSQQYLNVEVGMGNFRRESRRTVEGKQEMGEFVRQLVKNAKIRVRVGLRSILPDARFRFAGCIKVGASGPVRANNWEIDLLRTNLVQLPLELNSLNITCSTIQPDAGALLQLSGTVNQLYISPLVNTQLAASKLQAKEIYIRGVRKSDLDLLATDIVNILTLDSTTTTVALSGNPPHTRIRATKDPRLLR